jgi:excinuclease ABC subunit C
MDGGRGQVNICEAVLETLQLDIPVAGMVKDDHHRTRGLYFHNVEIPIDTHSECFALITRIQDETHRFAIEYHRSLRQKGQTRSVLEEIPGIGPKRRRCLMTSFETMEDLKAATVEQLEALPEMNRGSAEAVYAFFHND